MPRPQPDLFGMPPPAIPTGLVYAPGFVGAEEEGALAGRIAALPFGWSPSPAKAGEDFPHE